MEPFLIKMRYETVEKGEEKIMHTKSGGRLMPLGLRVSTLSLISLMLAASGCLAGEVVDRIERNFSVKERSLLYVRNSDGKTTLRATPGSEARIIAVKEVQKASSLEEARRAAAQVEVRVEQVGNRIEVEAKYPRIWGSWDQHPVVLVHFEVIAPATSDLDVHNSDGALEVAGFNGQMDLSTSDGNLTATQCSGRLRAHVSDGEMRIVGLQGELDARTSDGAMTLDGSFKALDVRSSDGKVELTVRPGSVIERAWSINSSDGDVQMRLPEGFNADLDVSTSDGSIRVDPPLIMTGTKASENHLVGKLNKGGLPLRIHTSDGSITIVK
jgi:hypothetical protein